MKKAVYTNYDELPVMLSVPDVANIMGLSLAGSYELTRSKDFPAFKVGSRIVIPKPMSEPSARALASSLALSSTPAAPL